jgi:hypothetical protein
LIPFSLFPSHAFLHGGLDAGALPTMEFSLPNVDQCHLKGQLWSEWSDFTSIVLVLGSQGSLSALALKFEQASTAERLSLRLCRGGLGREKIS